MRHSKLFLIKTNATRRAAMGVVGLCFVIEMMAALVAAGQTATQTAGALSTGALAAGKDAAAGKTSPTPESATERQRASVAAMAESLARQRASIQRQVGAAGDTGFFELPPPSRVSMVSRGAACDPLPETEIGSLVERVSKNEQVRPDLVRSVMQQESGFRPCAVSPKGAMGLMQLMPDTVSYFHVKDPFDAEANLAAGARFLKQLLDRYNGNLEKALSAYNAGTALVDAADGIPNIPETVDYVRQILGTLPKAK